MTPILMLILPLIGALAIVFAPAQRAYLVALATTILTLIVSLIGAFGFDHWMDGGFGWEVSLPFLAEFGITLNMGADTVSVFLVLLTTILMPLCVWGSQSAIRDRLREYYAWLLVIETAMIGVFIARDLVFFYICFELTLVPMYFLIAIYGGANRAAACVKFFIYTFTGSLITLAGLLYVAWRYAADGGGDGWNFDIPTLVEFSATQLSATQQAWVMFALLAGFAVKVPLFPVHTWLPLAHTEAPTAGSVILAAVLLKLGTYGLYRFLLPMTPLGLTSEASITLPLGISVVFIPIHVIGVLAVIGIIYAALVCWVQSDVKKLVAYSSVSHLGFCVLGLFALNPMGVQGSVLYMLNHGLSTGALFFLIGMIYERYHTRDMGQMSGLAKRMPIWAFFMVFFVLSSVGLPGLNGFVSEFLCLIGAFTASPDNSTYPGMLGPWYAAFAATGMILAAMYLLIMVGKVVFGPLKEPTTHDDDDHALPADLTLREIGVLTPLAILCIVIGMQPKLFTDPLEQPIENILSGYPAVVTEALADANHEATATLALMTPEQERSHGD